MRTCPNCLTKFPVKRRDQGFCSVACNRANEVRQGRRSKRLYATLYHWRLPANRRKGADKALLQADLRFIAREIASWIEEDEAAGVLPPPRHDHMADRGHQRTITRRAA